MSTRDEERLIISVDLPKGERISAAIASIARDLSEDELEESGYARSEAGQSIGWRLSRPADGAPIDPRQREAAALLLTAIDLPVDVMLWCRSIQEACSINPGMTLSSTPPRVTSLREARRLVDAMIEEADAADESHGTETSMASEAAHDGGVQVLRTFRLTEDEDSALSRMAFAGGTSRDELVVQAVRNLLSEASQ